MQAHQGDEVDLLSLPLDQRLNRMADELAKATFNKFHQSDFEIIPPFMAAQKVSFRTPYCRLVYDVKNKINEYKVGHEAESIIAKNWGIEKHT